MATLNTGAATARVRAARDFLLNHREDYATAYRDYRSPALEEFNWALDWFDAIAADGGDRPALWIVEPDGGETRRTFAELRRARTRWRTGCASAASPRRPCDRHARQPGRAVGDDPGHDEARRGDHSRHADARAR